LRRKKKRRKHERRVENRKSPGKKKIGKEGLLQNIRLQMLIIFLQIDTIFPINVANFFPGN